MQILVDHFERRLGRMTNGWEGVEQDGLPGVNVACFSGGPFADTTSYATVGLSQVPLHGRGDDRRHFFLEFLACKHGPDDGVQGLLPQALAFVSSRCVAAREAVLRGDVISMPDDIVGGGRFTCLYAALPVYYDPAFKSVVVENGDAVAVVWLIPITQNEAEFVVERGWGEFESELLKRDPDLMDMGREAIA